MIGIGLFLGKLLRGIGSFIAANWRWLVPLLLVCMLWWYITDMQAQRDDAVKALATLQQGIKDAAEARRLEIERKDARNIVAQNALKANHLAELEALRRNFDAKHQNDKTAAGRTIDQWRERVHLELAARYASGGSEVPATACGIAESREDGNAIATGSYVDTLETACAITTSDYNALWESWDRACKVYGCK
jgi:hypothetical protein